MGEIKLLDPTVASPYRGQVIRQLAQLEAFGIFKHNGIWYFLDKFEDGAIRNIRIGDTSIRTFPSPDLIAKIDPSRRRNSSIDTIRDTFRALGFKVASQEKNANFFLDRPDGWHNKPYFKQQIIGALERLSQLSGLQYDHQDSVYRLYFATCNLSKLKQAQINNIPIYRFPHASYIAALNQKSVITSLDDIKTIWQNLGCKIATREEENAHIMQYPSPGYNREYYRKAIEQALINRGADYGIEHRTIFTTGGQTKTQFSFGKVKVAKLLKSTLDDKLNVTCSLPSVLFIRRALGLAYDDTSKTKIDNIDELIIVLKKLGLNIASPIEDKSFVADAYDKATAIANINDHWDLFEQLGFRRQGPNSRIQINKVKNDRSLIKSLDLATIFTPDLILKAKETLGEKVSSSAIVNIQTIIQIFKLLGLKVKEQTPSQAASHLCNYSNFDAHNAAQASRNKLFVFLKALLTNEGYKVEEREHIGRFRTLRYSFFDEQAGLQNITLVPISTYQALRDKFGETNPNLGFSLSREEVHGLNLLASEAGSQLRLVFTTFGREPRQVNKQTLQASTLIVKPQQILKQRTHSINIAGHSKVREILISTEGSASQFSKLRQLYLSKLCKNYLGENQDLYDERIKTLINQIIDTALIKGRPASLANLKHAQRQVRIGDTLFDFYREEGDTPIYTDIVPAPFKLASLNSSKLQLIQSLNQQRQSKRQKPIKYHILLAEPRLLKKDSRLFIHELAIDPQQALKQATNHSNLYNLKC